MIPDGAREIHAGTDDKIIKMRGCPDCNGRGYFIVNPFAEVNKERYQCQRCEEEYNKLIESTRDN